MVEATISRLGRQGDGIAVVDGRDTFVPFTLPGETVTLNGKGNRRQVAELLAPSAERVAAVCPHYGICGGCQLQHMEHSAYLEWKKAILVDALNAEGITAPVETIRAFPIATRRKAVLNANRLNGALQFGYAERGSNDLVNISECHVLEPTLQESLEDIRAFISSLPLGAKAIRVSVLSTENGLDIHIDGDLRLAGPQRTAITQKAMDSGFARLSLNDETLIEARRPLLEMGIAQVSPPPGGFVQAASAAELDMAELVVEHLSGCKNVVDLFSGVGTFALRLAARSTVWALEDNAPAIASLQRAWRETGGKLKELKAEVRNLERRPVSFQELKKVQGLVFDPPRAGAELQCKQLAKSKVGKIAAVSCNPQTLARDLAILIEGGYKIERIIPIDQFRFTPHLEVVALLTR